MPLPVIPSEAGRFFLAFAKRMSACEVEGSAFDFTFQVHIGSGIRPRAPEADAQEFEFTSSAVARRMALDAQYP
jgi:hypothetical protein